MLRARWNSWFAGLVAGEGYFRIHKSKGGDYYACHFGIHMRADEGPMLRAVHRRLGVGQINYYRVETSKRGISSAPSIRYIVQSRADCVVIASVLDGEPLYGKKQYDYDVWRRALDVWLHQKRGNRWHGPGDRTAMRLLYEEMKLLRAFNAKLAAAEHDPFDEDR